MFLESISLMFECILCTEITQPDIWMSTDFHSQSIGDGKCFFRTLSYFLTGVQKEHQRLCALLCQFMHENIEQFKSLPTRRIMSSPAKYRSLKSMPTRYKSLQLLLSLGSRSGHSLLMVIPTDGSIIGQSGLPPPFSLTEKAMYIKICMNILSLCLVVKQVCLERLSLMMDMI